MRKARLLSTVAAALLLSVGAASAQPMDKDEAPAWKPGEQKASTKKGPETIGEAPKESEPDKSQMKKSQTMDKTNPASPAAKGSSDANGGPNKSKSTNSTAESAPGAAAPAAKSADER